MNLSRDDLEIVRRSLLASFYDKSLRGVDDHYLLNLVATFDKELGYY